MSEKRFANNPELLETETKQFFANLREKMTVAGFGTSESGLAPFLACINTKLFFPEEGDSVGDLSTEKRQMAKLWLSMKVLRSRTTAFLQEWRILQHSHGLLNYVVNINFERNLDSNGADGMVALDDLAASMNKNKKKAQADLEKWFHGDSGLPSTKEEYIEMYLKKNENPPNPAIKRLVEYITRELKRVQGLNNKNSWMKPNFGNFVKEVGDRVRVSLLNAVGFLTKPIHSPGT
jgi:hypothetical protein